MVMMYKYWEDVHTWVKVICNIVIEWRSEWHRTKKFVPRCCSSWREQFANIIVFGSNKAHECCLPRCTARCFLSNSVRLTFQPIGLCPNLWSHADKYTTVMHAQYLYKTNLSPTYLIILLCNESVWTWSFWFYWEGEGSRCTRDHQFLN